MADTRTLGDVFKNMFRDLGIEKPIEQSKAVNLWPNVVGERVSEVATAEKIENGIMIVRVSSPVWRNELIFMKADIINKLNTALNKHVVKDIKFT
jgi:predicted nucleic acid-binding Zn ribbon protein